MIDLLRSEWIKFRSVRSTVIVLALAAALVVLIAVLAANDAKDNTTGFECTPQTDASGQPVDAEPNEFCENGGTMEPTPAVTHLTDVMVGVNIAMVLFGVLGVQVIGQEYRFNTIRPTFTAVPNRFKVLAAKFVVLTVACAATAAAMLAVCWAIASMMVSNLEVDGVDQRAILGTILFSVGYAGLGMGLGAILRQPIAAIPVLLAESFVVEAILGGLVKATQPFLPFYNGIQMTGRGDVGMEDLRSTFAGGVYFGLVCVVVLGVGCYLVDKRDA